MPSLRLPAFSGPAYSISPCHVVDRMTIWDAASHHSALTFMLWGAAIVLPCIAGYTMFSCRVFRGKVRGALYK
ncbi:MAG: cytochrome d ubiquinol oxidase subunit II [Burkholderiales bacterium]|nr:cytochrome d ubiquinol oxidase subunit II [Burkholderiales bacterium]